MGKTITRKRPAKPANPSPLSQADVLAAEAAKTAPLRALEQEFETAHPGVAHDAGLERGRQKVELKSMDPRAIEAVVAELRKAGGFLLKLGDEFYVASGEKTVEFVSWVAGKKALFKQALANPVVEAPAPAPSPPPAQVDVPVRPKPPIPTPNVPEPNVPSPHKKVRAKKQ